MSPADVLMPDRNAPSTVVEKLTPEARAKLDHALAIGVPASYKDTYDKFHLKDAGISYSAYFRYAKKIRTVARLSGLAIADDENPHQRLPDFICQQFLAGLADESATPTDMEKMARAYSLVCNVAIHRLRAEAMMLNAQTRSEAVKTAAVQKAVAEKQKARFEADKANPREAPYGRKEDGTPWTHEEFCDHLDHAMDDIYGFQDVNRTEPLFDGDYKPKVPFQVCQCDACMTNGRAYRDSIKNGLPPPPGAVPPPSPSQTRPPGLSEPSLPRDAGGTSDASPALDREAPDPSRAGEEAGRQSTTCRTASDHNARGSSNSPRGPGVSPGANPAPPDGATLTSPSQTRPPGLSEPSLPRDAGGTSEASPALDRGAPDGGACSSSEACPPKAAAPPRRGLSDMPPVDREKAAPSKSSGESSTDKNPPDGPQSKDPPLLLRLAPRNPERFILPPPDNPWVRDGLW